MLPPRDPSTPPFRIPLHAPPSARPRGSRPRTNPKMLWASIVFWLTLFPVTNILADQLVRGHDVMFHIIVGVWFTLVDAIIYLAAVLIFKLHKTE